MLKDSGRILEGILKDSNEILKESGQTLLGCFAGIISRSVDELGVASIPWEGILRPPASRAPPPAPEHLVLGIRLSGTSQQANDQLPTTGCLCHTRSWWQRTLAHWV